jgi:hypothetical protein
MAALPGLLLKRVEMVLLSTSEDYSPPPIRVTLRGISRGKVFN